MSAEHPFYWRSAASAMSPQMSNDVEFDAEWSHIADLRVVISQNVEKLDREICIGFAGRSRIPKLLEAKSLRVCFLTLGFLCMSLLHFVP